MTSLVNEDRLLIKRLLKGDEQAFARFFADQFPRVYRFALSRTRGDQALAEEVAQETLCRAMEKLSGWRGEAGLTSWLFTICRNLLSDRFRGPAGRTRNFFVPDDDPEISAALESLESAQADDPERSGMAAELRLAVQAALDYLPSRQARALRLKYFEGSSVRELAQVMELTEKAAESLLSRARRDFREAFALLQDRPTEKSGSTTA